MPEVKIPVFILIPMADNDGRLFEPEHDTQFLAMAADEIGGCTLLPTLAAGVWVEEGITYTDQSRVLLVSVAGLIANGERVRQVAELAKQHYRQLAVYVQYLGVSEIL